MSRSSQAQLLHRGMSCFIIDVARHNCIVSLSSQTFYFLLHLCYILLNSYHLFISPCAPYEQYKINLHQWKALLWGEQELARLTGPFGELGIREIPAAFKAYQSRAEVSSYSLYLKNPKGIDLLEDRCVCKPSNTEGRTGQSVPDIHDWPRLALYKTAVPIASHRHRYEIWFPVRPNEHRLKTSESNMLNTVYTSNGKGDSRTLHSGERHNFTNHQYHILIE
jgi:hypothetical protein